MYKEYKVMSWPSLKNEMSKLFMWIWYASHIFFQKESNIQRTVKAEAQENVCNLTN
jgi:hypothetical protein